MADIAIGEGDGIPDLSMEKAGEQFRLTMEAEHLVAEVQLEASVRTLSPPPSSTPTRLWLWKTTPSLSPSRMSGR